MTQNLINKNNLPSWTFKNKYVFSTESILDWFKYTHNIEPNIYGFVYGLQYSDDTFYIGKKNFYKYVDKPITFNTKFRKNVVGTPFNKRIKGKLVLHETVQTETNWLKYTGSHSFEEPKYLLKRKIVDIAFSKLHLTFLENFYLSKYILKQGCLNQHISDKIYRDRLKDDIIKSIGEEKFNQLYRA